MENLTKRFPNVSSVLDIDFYSKFYNLALDEKHLREHFNTVGVENHLVPNWEMLSEVLASVLNFNTEVYKANMSHSFTGQLIKDFHPNAGLKQFLSHFYGLDSIQPGQLVSASMFRAINTCQLSKFHCKWNALIQKLYRDVQFDPDYYAFLNKIDNVDDMFKQWLTVDLYKNKYPNLGAFNRQDNLITNMTSFLHNQGVDLNYIMTEYGPKLNADLSSLSDVERSVFVFFNYAKRFCFFWNKAERDDYMAEHKGKFDEAVAYLKNMHFYNDKAVDALHAEQATQLSEALRLLKTNQLTIRVKTVKHLDLPRQLGLLKKIVNATYIDNFKAVNQLDDSNVHAGLLTNVLKNIVHVSGPMDYNSMDIKAFVSSFMYNVHLAKKKAMPSAEYMAMVKKHAQSFLESFLSALNVAFESGSLEKDLEFLVEHKKIIKFARLAVKIALLFV